MADGSKSTTPPQRSELRALINEDANVEYGATPSAPRSTESNESWQDDDDNENDSDGGADSFHLGKSKVRPSNMWASKRMTESFMEHGQEFDQVPTLVKDNVTLLIDSNLSSEERGRLYVTEAALHNVAQEPFYAVTVNDTIYQRVFREVGESRQVPCGLYFCCHGGDGAHTGISHDDYVDIRLAWALVIVMFAVMMWFGESG